MSNKRPNSGTFNLRELSNKKNKTAERVAAINQSSTTVGPGNANPFLSQPVHPDMAIQKFLIDVRDRARRYLPQELQQQRKPITRPFCEVEARLGILRCTHAIPDRRITSSGSKTFRGNNTVVQAFNCTKFSVEEKRCNMLSGVSRSHYLKTTGSGLSEISPLTKALGVTKPEQLKHGDLVETNIVETVYTGYGLDARICFHGEHNHTIGSSNTSSSIGKKESKEKLSTLDLTIPASKFDLRVSLSSEKILDQNIGYTQPQPGWKSKRVKRRRSYKRRDKTIAWQIDVTEVTTTTPSANNANTQNVDFEIEFEILPDVLLKLINEIDENKLKELTKNLAKQLWWIITQINPLHEALDVEDKLQTHPNQKAVQFAIAQCTALHQFMKSGCQQQFQSAIGKPEPPPSNNSGNRRHHQEFPGCMPVNFTRHHLEKIQRSPSNSYFLSEKTDGVRYLMVFTGETVVLVDRRMRGKQPIPTIDAANAEPFAPIMNLIQPGTVFDGEVVMNRRSGKQPRPIFIVFDVMAISTTQPVLHLPFEQRLRQHLYKATFRTPHANRDMFDERFVADTRIALPLVRKNFVQRTGCDELLSKVFEEKGMRCYRSGDLHNHLTDGIIFQPNLPYKCGTDENLLKWKYLDTVTVDVELLLANPMNGGNDDDDDEGEDGKLPSACLGEEQTRVDMTRHVKLPKCERLRLEADKYEDGGNIAEVGFDPESGDWFYLTMRGDKHLPNHIKTVLGSLVELAECITTEELRFRMSIPAGTPDTFRKDMRKMLNTLLEHQRQQLRGGQQQQQRQQQSSANRNHR